MTTLTYIFDNNIYRPLTRISNEGAISRFNNSLDLFPFFEKKGLQDVPVRYRATPFSVMEALGVKVKLKISLASKEYDDYEACFHDICNSIKNAIEECGELSEFYINEKHLAQKKYTSLSASFLDDTMIGKYLCSGKLLDDLKSSLFFDTISKYNFPTKFSTEILWNKLIPTLFAKDPVVFNFSKLRIARKVWIDFKNANNINDILGCSFGSLMKAAMQMDPNADFLDSDLIHFVCLGDRDFEDTHPVVVFTGDKFETLAYRVCFYKSFIEAIIRYLEFNVSSDYSKLRTLFSPGHIAICNNNCEVVSVSSVNDIEVII